MTLIAGMISLMPGRAPGPDACSALQAVISRFPGDEVATWSDGRCFLAKVDSGAFGAPGVWISADGNATTLIAGEPLLGARPAGTGRDVDVRLIHEALRGGDNGDVLRTSRGVFSVADYNAADGSLLLATDKLGVRPMFYSIGPEYLVFASALRIIEACPTVLKVMDLRGATELTSLGFSLGSRTSYANISLLRAGELLRVTGSDVSTQRYWRWDEVAPTSDSDETVARRAYGAFMDAIDIRLQGDRSTIAFLSGGLDSRAIVAGLRARGVNAHTFNFARPGTLDQRLGALFATAAGTLHEEVPMGADDPRWSAMMADAWAASARRNERPVERPQVVWSGDGGSVGIGHVYISRDTAERLRAGDASGAIEAYLQGQSAAVQRRLLTSEATVALDGVLHRGIAEELADARTPDRVRAFYLFLMHTDQHWHLSRHFEDIDLHRLEFQLPFFDSAVLEEVVSLPGERCLGHAFYMKWMECFPDVVRSVPWQTYPGHIPCPIPSEVTGAYQWDDEYRASVLRRQKNERLRHADVVLDAQDFPREIMRRGYLRLATWAYRSGVRDTGYVLDVARRYHEFWRVSGGRYSATSLPQDNG